MCAIDFMVDPESDYQEGREVIFIHLVSCRKPIVRNDNISGRTILNRKGDDDENNDGDDNDDNDDWRDILRSAGIQAECLILTVSPLIANKFANSVENPGA